jgi:hypothetical protein
LTIKFGRRGVLIRKKINLKTGGKILEELKEETKDGIDVSLRAFIALNRDTLSSSGKNLKELHEYLKARGLDVGTYYGFQSACYRAGLRQRVMRVAASREPASNAKREKVLESTGQGRTQKPQQAKSPDQPENHKARQSKRNPVLPPVFLPGGVEAIIDLETGAQSFDIKSGKESETT